ncbi:MAG: thioredoxin-disulfide reductase [Candidatus Marinimicrobia bacterium]|nr:thioredoxin-disulfide reductase [Candidatus Neomarinimicrobiota bacterium]
MKILRYKFKFEKMEDFKMNNNTADVIIIGGGPGGLTTAIYTSRGGLNTVLLEKNICGGLPATTDLIENYSGFPDGINGMELMEKFKKQTLRFGTNIIEFKEVKKVEPVGEKIKIQTTDKEYYAYTVIVASGSVPKKLNVPGEKEYESKGVSYCATCDGPLYRDKDVAVIGCGNSGLQEGEGLLNYAKSVTFIEFLPFMTAESILQERLQKNKKANFLLNHELISINGDQYVNSITVKDRQTNEEKKIEISGIFIYAGFLPNSKFLKDVVELDKLGNIITNEKMETSVPGIYAVGDIRSKKVRQISVACGEGTIAAISAHDYIKEKIENTN